MATFVLVHGGGHGGWCYQKVARLLRADGHEVSTPTLTGLGERSHFVRPGLGLSTHVADVVNLLRWEDLHDVILVGHSYGGMVTRERPTSPPIVSLGSCTSTPPTRDRVSRSSTCPVRSDPDPHPICHAEWGLGPPFCRTEPVRLLVER